MPESRPAMKRSMDLATVKDVFMLIQGGINAYHKELEAKLLSVGIDLSAPKAVDCSTSTEQLAADGTPCE